MKADALRGHLDSLILAVLEGGPLHGYAVMETLRERSGGELDLATGTLYPALRRLERAAYVRGEWDTVGGRRRRTYRLTPAGRRMLGEERADWERFAAVVGGMLGRPGSAPA
jgi:DNA-binding PadR family transcriptional regulator